MKKNLITALSLIACFSAFSQEEINPVMRSAGTSEQSPTPTTVEPQVNTTMAVSKSKTTTISKRAGEPQRVHDQAYYQEEIAKIDNHKTAIDQKIAHVNSNPQEKLKAESNGWFQHMEDIKTDLLAKKKILQEKLAKL